MKGLVAQVAISIGDYTLASIIAADAVAELGLKNWRYLCSAGEIFPGDDLAQSGVDNIPRFFLFLKRFLRLRFA